MNEQRDYNKYESNYIQMPFEPILLEYRRRIVIENLVKYQHQHILEIGCGTEPLFKHFKEYSSMTIIEPCTSFYQNACKQRDSNAIKIINGLFENVARDLNNKKFDFVIISCLLHEIPDSAVFLNKLYDVSNSLTTIHINVPNARSFHRILAQEMGLIDSIFDFSSNNVIMQQQRVFDLESLSNLLVDQSFRILESGSYFIKPFTHSQMEELMDHQIIDRKILDGLFRMTNSLPGLGSEIFVNCAIQ